MCGISSYGSILLWLAEVLGARRRWEQEKLLNMSDINIWVDWVLLRMRLCIGDAEGVERRCFCHDTWHISPSVKMKSCQCVWLLVLEGRSISSWLAHYRNLSCAAMALAMVGEHSSTFSEAQGRKLCVLCQTAQTACSSFRAGLTGGLSFLAFCLKMSFIISLSCLDLTADVSSVLKTKSRGGEQGLSVAIAWVHLQCLSACLLLQLNGWCEVWTDCSVAVSSPSWLLQGN